METTIGSEKLIIDIKKKKTSVFGVFGKFCAFAIGGFGILLSAFLFITIIGILPAIGLFYMSLGLIYLALGKQQVSCPHCKKKQHVLKTAENFNCPKCKNLTIINWK
jgi:hypothetical protein